MSEPNHPPGEVEGEVLPARKSGISWAWLFPLLALLATIWLFWSDWQSQGPEITISFAEAPGIQAGKTALLYRGVQAGEVTSVRLDDNLRDVLVTVRLKAFAQDLAREDTDFWIQQPVISLREIAGLESIIQGNSIQARAGTSGKIATRFTGLGNAPLSQLDSSALLLTLRADSIPFLGRTTPVFHRGVRVGWVRDKMIEDGGRAAAQIIIEEAYAHVVRSNSRFWTIPATSVRAAPGQVALDIPAIDALLYGGVEFDQFSPGGSDVASGAEFELFADAAAARAEGPPLEIILPEAAGMRAGQTRVCYLGHPVGILESLDPDPASGSVLARVRLEALFARLATASSVFTVVRPSLGPDGITGLETIITGPYIDFAPGGGDAPGTKFIGRTRPQLDWNPAREQPGSIRFVLQAAALPPLEPGAPVYHGGIIAGRVVEKQTGKDGRPEVIISVERDFAGSVRTNTRFWHVPAANVAAGPGILDVKFEGLAALWQGGIAFDVFGAPDAASPPGRTFELHPSRRVAAAVSPPIRIEVDNAQGLLAGQTELRYLGVPAGVVVAVEATKESVVAVARFFEGFDFLRRSGSQFAIVRPEVSLKGVHGLEALISGVYFVCVPGKGDGFSTNFATTRSFSPQLLEDTGFEINLVADATPVDVGALVLYNDTPVGEITQKILSPDGSEIRLTARIRDTHRNLVRESSVFWNASAVEARVGFFKVEIQAPSVIAPAGRVAFFTRDMSSPLATEGADFDLRPRRPRRL